RFSRDWSSDVCSSDLWASTKIAHPEPRRRKALLSRPATATSSAGTAESRSGPRKRAVRWKLPSLLRTTPSPTSAAQGRKSARRVDRKSVVEGKREAHG